VSEDFYSVLGVSREATDSEIKKAFRKKAMQYHPDRNPGDKEAEEQFKRVQEAYDVLSDTKKKSIYDQVGHQQYDRMQSGGYDHSAAGGAAGGAHGFGDFFDFFSDLRAESGEASPQGRHMQVEVEVSLEEAFSGVEKTISAEALVACERCKGCGSADQKTHVCKGCGGTGQNRMQRGFMVFAQVCRSCQGQGTIITNPCRSCKGQGATFGHRRIRLTIPAGVEDDVQLRVSGQGHAGVRGASPGDLYAHVRITPHDLFMRQDDHILCRAPISMVQAALGGSIELPTIEGKRVSITIPSGSQTDDRLRVKGHGFVRYRTHSRGDMFVQVIVEIPHKLTAKQKELLEEFDACSKGPMHQPATNSFFKKVSSFLRYGDKK